MNKSLLGIAVVSLLSAAGSASAASKIELSKAPVKFDQQQKSMTSHPINQQLKLSQQYQFEAGKVIKDKQGNLHTRYQQKFLGVPVWGQQVVVHNNKARNESKLSGQALAKIENDIGQQVTPKLVEKQVLGQVKDNLRSKLGANINITREEAELVIYHDDKINKALLAYHLEVLALSDNQEPARYMFIVDANSGRVIKSWNAIAHIDATGPGGNTKTGRYEYGTDYPAMRATDDGNGTCFLENENVRAVNLGNVFDNTSNTPFSFSCPENTFQEINGAYSPINDAFYFGNLTFDMYSEWYDTAPLPFQLSMKVHFGTNFQNAFWDGQAMTFGDGGSTFFPLVDVNVSIHEVSHGFTEFNSNLIYSSQSGGMNEAFSDIAAEAGEYFWRGEVDWFVGGDIMKNADGLRYFEDPAQDGVSASHFNQYFEGMDVHYSSGIFNRAYYLLSNKTGWNPHTAFDVFVLANQAYWQADSTFDEGACGVIAAAFDLGYQWFDVYDAFNTVGVSCTGNGIDGDADGMSDISELLYGFNPEDPSDALADFDGDGISNLAELTQGFDPKDKDTDDDGLEDGMELSTLATGVNNPDSDDDGMTDGWEVANGLNPLNGDDASEDADGDGYSNSTEFDDGTDPQDENSYLIKPVNKASVYDFENQQTLPGSAKYPAATANFVVTNSDAFNSSFSLGSEDIGDNQWTAISWDIVAEDGVLTFDRKTSTEAGWDWFVVFIDFVDVYVTSGSNDWQTISVPITAGAHNIIFYYEKDGSVSSGQDTVWVDNVYYTGLSFDADGDGMVDAWEDAYGLDKDDPADAALDLDEDGLTNLEEYDLDTDPSVVDTDGDDISDFDEVDGGITSPIMADTDGDMINDGLELSLGLDPTDPADGLLDLDQDGINNSTEAKYGTNLASAASYPTLLNYTNLNFNSALDGRWIAGAAETWTIEQDAQGNAILRAQPTSNSKTARIDYLNVFDDGRLTFEVIVDSEADYDELVVLVDGVEHSAYSGMVTQQVVIDLVRGEHLISLLYRKNAGLSSTVDRVAIDNFKFVAPDADTDGDGLSNAAEMVLGTDMTKADTDGDGLSDSEEIAMGTDPKNSDTDGDGVSDKQDLFPNDATRWTTSGSGSIFYLVGILGILGFARRRSLRS